MSRPQTSNLRTNPMSTPGRTEQAPQLRIYSGEADGSPPADKAATAAHGSPPAATTAAALQPSIAPAVERRTPEPSEAYFAYLKTQSERLETATPKQIVEWAVAEFAPKLTMATAFGPEGMVIIHLLSQVDRGVPVFKRDTGYQFRETLELRDRVLARYGIDVELRRPETTVEQYEQQHGGPLYKLNPDQCCRDRKIRVLEESAKGWFAWMSGIRRDQSSDRARAPIVGWDKKFGLVKISPLANATKKDVWRIITDEDVPYNSLHDQGYTSIGCWPCTRAVMFGEDERAGRWSGFAKTECGLHTSDDK